MRNGEPNNDHQGDDACFLDALYRGRGRCERRICDAKDTGLSNLPSASFAINAAGLASVLTAGDLLAWLKGLCLDGELARGRALGAPHHLAHRRRLALGRRPRSRLHPTAALVERLSAFHRSSCCKTTSRSS